MQDKCAKFESLFIFSDEKFGEHLETCEDCRHEFEKFKKLSLIIQEAKPLYFKRKNKAANLKIALMMSLVILAGTVFATITYNPMGIADTIKYGETLCAEDYGFPVDSYGLIMVD